MDKKKTVSTGVAMVLNCICAIVWDVCAAVWVVRYLKSKKKSHE